MKGSGASIASVKYSDKKLSKMDDYLKNVICIFFYIYANREEKEFKIIAIKDSNTKMN